MTQKRINFILTYANECEKLFMLSQNRKIYKTKYRYIRYGFVFKFLINFNFQLCN